MVPNTSAISTLADSEDSNEFVMDFRYMINYLSLPLLITTWMHQVVMHGPVRKHIFGSSLAKGNVSMLDRFILCLRKT